MKALVIGGNRFFGKRLVRKLLSLGANVTVLNRGSRLAEFEQEWGIRVKTLVCDRTRPSELKAVTTGLSWDVIFDQACYDAEQASLACEVFNSRTKKYVFTSSQSVYPNGASLREEMMDASKRPFTTIARADTDYGEAKRQAESTFIQKGQFELISVRFPMVLGEDDYTGRLRFHVERIKQERPIYFPNIDARISFVHAQDAAECLYALGNSGYSGPINVASGEPIRLRKLVNWIEEKVGKKAILLTAEQAANQADDHSPMGIQTDWWMEVSRLSALGIYTRPIEQWIQNLI